MTDTLSVIVENVRVPINAGEREIAEAAAGRLRGFRIVSSELYKRSVDARKKNDISLVCSVAVCVEASAREREKLINSGFKIKTEEDVVFTPGKSKLSSRPVVIGFGPAGMFASLYLAAYGYRPLVLERGGCVSDRVAAVDKFIKYGILDPECNVQFGAGGAGTFSDGKLTTRINDPYVRGVLRDFVSFGAPESVTKRAKPHIGTDVLRDVVENIHEKIVTLGGEIRYNTKVTDVGDGYVTANGEKIPCGAAVIAVGHSARDLYKTLYDASYAMESKPFSVGVRIEHLTCDIDRAMYGDEALSEILGHAEYALSHRTGERGVYTFCMCPGGEVIAAASEEGGVVTNGMSNSRRDGVNSNAAVAVSVLPGDTGADPMSAIAFQRNLERAAFVAGGCDYRAPATVFSGFCKGEANGDFGRVVPTYRGGAVTPYDLNRLFPEYISSMIREGVIAFGKKIKGFDSPDAVITGVESRTSAPVRIIRGEDFVALGKRSVYPCGEGAGYAGGIVSAAVDGIRVAGAIISKYSPIS